MYLQRCRYRLEVLVEVVLSVELAGVRAKQQAACCAMAVPFLHNLPPFTPSAYLTQLQMFYGSASRWLTPFFQSDSQGKLESAALVM
jgi:hypothetical protein